MLLTPGCSLSSSSFEDSSLLDDIMLSTASTSSQRQPNLWFPGSSLPSFFPSSPPTTGGSDKISYNQPLMINKTRFDSSACSSSSGSSPPLTNDFVLARSDSATATKTTTTLNLTQFNYIQQNHHHHHHPCIVTQAPNNFLPRDDWPPIPMAQTRTADTSAWHPQHTTKGTIFLTDLYHPIVYRTCSIPHS